MKQEIGAEDSFFAIHNMDSRNMLSFLPKSSGGRPLELVDATITSPPYHNLKDYGYDNQIGYGQQFDHYLRDMRSVFSSVFQVTKKTGCLWLVADTFKKHGEVVPLPFDLAREAKAAGWKLRDIIIWEKDKTLPWSSKGALRGSFEYVLFLTKSDDFTYHLDEIRETKLEKWWITFTERYNPKGKSPTGNWYFPIPVQGGWRKGYLRHFCPLPAGLIHRLLVLSTNEGDVVLDPFAGSGVVVATAEAMNRRGMGFELNKDYVKRYYDNVRREIITEMAGHLEKQKEARNESADLEKKILSLRQLKYPKVMLKRLRQSYPTFPRIDSIFVVPSNGSSQSNGGRIKDDIYLIVSRDGDPPSVEAGAVKECEASDLLTFGIEPTLRALRQEEFLKLSLNLPVLYLYANGITWNYRQKISLAEWSETNSDGSWHDLFKNGICPIISPIEMSISYRKNQPYPEVTTPSK